MSNKLLTWHHIVVSTPVFLETRKKDIQEDKCTIC